MPDASADAAEGAAEHVRCRLDRQRLREPRDSLDQEVALRQEADEDALEHLVLACDHPPDLEQRLLDRHRVRGVLLLAHDPPGAVGCEVVDAPRALAMRARIDLHRARSVHVDATAIDRALA